jgi:hypothetical protein
MPEPLETRICIRKNKRTGRVEISVYDPASRKEVRTGMEVWPGEVDANVFALKSKLERAGNRVTFAEL